MIKLTPNRPVKMTIYSAPDQVPIVRAALEKMCELLGFSEEDAGGVILSVDEALANVIKHAYDGDHDRPIEVDLTRVGDEANGALAIRVRDWGRQVDPSEIRGRDLDDIRPGGLGVHIMQKCMDSVEYSPTEGGGTVLTMVKKLLPVKKDCQI